MEILKKLNITPKNLNLYIEAITHKSYANEKNLNYDYQLLEFVGDAIINKIIAIYLYKKGLKTEGELTKQKILMVQSSTMVKACYDSGLINEILLGKGELENKKISDNIAEDVFESFCGALYFDQSENVLFNFLKQNIIKYYETGLLTDSLDYKTQLQELLQSFSNHAIEYKLDKSDASGDGFHASVWFNSVKYGQGKGSTRKKAEKEAAKAALLKLANQKIEIKNNEEN